MIKETDSYYLDQKEPDKSCLLALRSLILKQDKEVWETQKYGMPCFCYKKKAFCYLWTDRKTGEPYVLIVEGNLLDHPALEQGNRSRMKILRVNPNEDIPVSTVEMILQSALDLYR